MDRGQDVLALRAATQLRAIRMVANSGGRGRTRSAVYFLKSGQTFLELAGLAKSPEVRRHNRFYRGRVDAESLQRARLRRGGLRHDIVASQQFDLIGGQHRLRE